jgi:hypothetical protein
MTQPLTIPTPFNDVSELTDNFATRVDETQLMLPYSEPVGEDVWVSFTVLLADGSVALEGTGRAAGTQDNGEEYPPEYRYDVTLDSLQLEGMSEVMFERFLQARQSQLEGEPGTGEIDLQQVGSAAEAPLDEPSSEVSASAVAAVAESPADADDPAPFEEAYAAPADLPTEARPIEPSAPMEALEAMPEEAMPEQAMPEQAVPEQAVPEQAMPEPAMSEEAMPEPASEEWLPDEAGFVESVTTQAVVLETLLQPVVPAAPSTSPVRGASPARAAAPPQVRGALPLLHTFEHGVLTRPSATPAWQPEIAPRRAAMESSGLFEYRGGLPRPAAPPHPDLPAEQRVVAAPSPSAPWSRHA